MIKAGFLALVCVVLIACAGKKSDVVYVNDKKQDVVIKPETKKEIKKVVSDETKLPETKAKEIEKIVKKEKIETKKKIEKKVIKTLSSYKKEKIEKEISLLNEPVTPVKTPDVVLRVLLLPYVDEDNTFHSGEYLFVKVEEGKWILGDYVKSGKKVIKEYNPLVEVKK